MTTRRNAVIGFLGGIVFFLAVQIGALLLQAPFEAAEYQAVENPGDPTNSIFYIGVLLVATVGMLFLLKYDLTRVLRVFIVLTSGFIAAYVFSVFVPPIIGEPGTLHLGAVLGGSVVVIGLAVYPEWWVIDGAALVMGMGAAALFGISLDVLPVIILLSVLAVYDAISVYGTEHMLTLASGVMELRVPVLVILPTTLSFSFREFAAEMPDESPESDQSKSAELDQSESAESDQSQSEESDSGDPSERDAFFIGLGDVVIPTILVVSAATFLDVPTVFGVGIPSMGAILGTLIGLVLLLSFVMKGRPHAGLPLLNGGAVGGYLIGAIASGLSLLEALGLAGYIG